MQTAEASLKIFQRFDIRPHSESYELSLKTSLTIKPEGLLMHVSTRKDRQALQYTQSNVTLRRDDDKTSPQATSDDLGKKPMSIFYGSNAGTCKALAYKLKGEASMHGYNAEVAVLNTLSTGNLPKDQPVAMITASYEGQVRSVG